MATCCGCSLEWLRPKEGIYSTWDDSPLDGSDPSRMVFVFRRACDFLPQERASLHAFGFGFTEELALAPYAIDDATDEFSSRRKDGVRPDDYLSLAADNLNALFWGLHDWAHFHNHGPFEQRALTEFQCDTSALVWLYMNRTAVSLSESGWLRLFREVRALSAGRFREERALDLAASWPSARVTSLATALSSA